MIIEKFNLKAQASIERACRLAVEKDHGVVTPWHFLYALLEIKNHIGCEYLKQANIDLVILDTIVGGQLLAQPKALKSTQHTPIDRELERLFIHAEQISISMDDKYIGLQYLLMALWELDEWVAALTEAGGSKESFSEMLEDTPKGGYKNGENIDDFEYLNKYAGYRLKSDNK